MWQQKGELTFSWSWTLAPFFNRVSTTFVCPYWEATVRAVPPSWHKDTQEETSRQCEGKSCVTYCGENNSKVAWAAYFVPYHCTKHAWLFVRDDSIAAVSVTPRMSSRVTVPGCIPSSGIRWRLRIQRGVSRRHYDPAVRRRTRQWNLSGADDEKKTTLLSFSKAITLNLFYLMCRIWEEIRCNFPRINTWKFDWQLTIQSCCSLWNCLISAPQDV